MHAPSGMPTYHVLVELDNAWLAVIIDDQDALNHLLARRSSLYIFLSLSVYRPISPNRSSMHLPIPLFGSPYISAKILYAPPYPSLWIALSMALYLSPSRRRNNELFVWLMCARAGLLFHQTTIVRVLSALLIG